MPEYFDEDDFKTVTVMGVVTGVIMTLPFVYMALMLSQKEDKVASVPTVVDVSNNKTNFEPKKIGTHAACSKCGACISGSENVR